MSTRNTSLHVTLASILLALLTVAVLAARQEAPDQSKRMELVTLTGEITAIDAASHSVTLRGPLGGEVSGKVSPEVKNLAQVKVGDLVTVAYYESLAVSVKKKGEATALFTSASGDRADEGELPSGYVARTSTALMTVVAVDAEKRSLVVQDDKGVITAVAVQRPEFAAKLIDLKAGDQLEVSKTEAFIVNVSPAASGAKPSVSVNVSTLVVEHGEVVRRMNNTVWVRNEHGRTVKVVVDPKFKFKLNGKDATVEDLEPGVKLTRTAFRVIESARYEEP
jgi:hypothetical protein